MTNAEFTAKLKRVFNNHMLMDNRNRHTVNELLYILTYNEEFKGTSFNITIVKLNGGCYCIPTLDTFVTVSVRAIWFEDDKIEFERDETIYGTYNCITIYESEEK